MATTEKEILTEVHYSDNWEAAIELAAFRAIRTAIGGMDRLAFVAEIWRPLCEGGLSRFVED